MIWMRWIQFILTKGKCENCLFSQPSNYVCHNIYVAWNFFVFSVLNTTLTVCFTCPRSPFNTEQAFQQKCVIAWWKQAAGSNTDWVWTKWALKEVLWFHRTWVTCKDLHWFFSTSGAIRVGEWIPPRPSVQHCEEAFMGCWKELMKMWADDLFH